MDFCIIFQKTEKRFVIKMRGMKQNFGEVYIHILEFKCFSCHILSHSHIKCEKKKKKKENRKKNKKGCFVDCA